MEHAAILVGIFVIGFLLASNSPIEMSPQAWGMALATVLFTIVGGASFFGRILQAALPEPQEAKDFPEKYFEHRHNVFHRGRAKFNTDDRFYHTYGVCCDGGGHCESCVKSQAEKARYFMGMDQDMFDMRMREALEH
ncbi:hypothetical protein F53441_7857 [Fusarium austroafricanum]|uniref:Uncharacterized protein n=1 Tax=Fusarium austroafricanum TaxID=2364996 RepID=A0A8H4KFQ0_9HYPO|nr:hypothetical protein F53441_7857 [Fusarium austroafricanum]